MRTFVHINIKLDRVNKEGYKDKIEEYTFFLDCELPKLSEGDTLEDTVIPYKIKLKILQETEYCLEGDFGIFGVILPTICCDDKGVFQRITLRV